MDWGIGAVVVHAFNPSSWEAETGRFLSLRPHRETLSRKKKKKQNKTKKKKRLGNRIFICRFPINTSEPPPYTLSVQY
jgi:hypothetical protein